MKRATLMALATFAVMSTTVNAKQWKSEVVTMDGGQVNIVKTVESCNYARTVSLARKEAEKHKNAYLNLNGIDNQQACPKKTRKPKAE